MKKRIWLWALVALLLFALLTGCTPADSAAVPPRSTPTNTNHNTVILPETTTPMASAYPTPDPDMISQQLALDIALLHAGVHADEAEFLQIEFDIDDGRAEFEVQFYVGNVEYEYEIDAKNGAIISFDKDYD